VNGETAASPRLQALYEGLARFQWWRRRWARAAPGQGLELHKRLLPFARGADAGGAAPRDLDEWLGAQVDRARLPARPRVLDLGCGFGSSLLHWARTHGAGGLGLSSSPYQIAKATAAAQQAGLADRCRFVVQSFEQPVAGPFDVVLAIESLGHAADLGAVLRRAAQVLDAAGTLLLVDDLLRAPASGDADVAELAARWSSPPLRTRTEVRAALAGAGLAVRREVDLSAQVPARHRPARRTGRLLRALRAIAPSRSARGLADAFLGGLALERLYARQLVDYVFFAASPVDGPR
jgi:SAM-dependent methyltransferase